jgi:hypothetical protein
VYGSIGGTLLVDKLEGLCLGTIGLDVGIAKTQSTAADTRRVTSVLAFRAAIKLVEWCSPDNRNESGEEEGFHKHYKDVIR